MVVDDLLERGFHEAALVVCVRSLATCKDQPKVWANVASILLALGRYQEALDALGKAREGLGDHPTVTYLLGLVHARSGSLREAEGCFQRCIEVEPRNLGAVHALSLVHLKMGNYEPGFAFYEARIAIDGYTSPIEVHRDGSLKGKHVYLASEQGVGDTIAFSRFVPWLCSQAAKVTWCLPYHLVALFLRFEEIPNLQIVMCDPVSSGADRLVYMGSLPLLSRCTLATLPADPGFIRRNAGLFPIRRSSKVNVGICWAGNAAAIKHQARNVPLNLLLGLAAYPQVELHSFQVGPAASDVAAIGADELVNSVDLHNGEWMSTAMALAKMDLVVTCCTGVAHLSAALGIPTWVMLAHDPFWLWMLDREDSPWYPSVRLFRQPSPGDWTSVASAVQRALGERIACSKSIPTGPAEAA
jgi:tetratricopeptide (TPR) repeat protein